MTNLQKTAQPAKADQVAVYLLAAKTRLFARQNNNPELSREAGNIMQTIQKGICQYQRKERTASWKLPRNCAEAH